MNALFPYFIASSIAACAWTVFAIMIYPRYPRPGPFLGLVGAWAGSLFMASLWRSDAVPWLAGFAQGIVLLWLGAIGLVILAAILTLISKGPGRGLLASCAIINFLINCAAGVHFLWLATVSPGGV